MARADDLEQERAALKMINPAPYNAEAPPEALAEDITAVALHYVRSNFAVPTHDGSPPVSVSAPASTSGASVGSALGSSAAGPPGLAVSSWGRPPGLFGSSTGPSTLCRV